MTSKPVVLAVAAHPDDIEFMMAGTLILLKDAGCDVHMWNLANGCCGSNAKSRDEIARIRWEEAQHSAAILGAVAHAPLFDDLAIFYDRESLAKVASVLRTIRPGVVLTHSPQDYMEDHMNTARLAVTAAFMRGMKNAIVHPHEEPYEAEVALYHAMPHGLDGPLGERLLPNLTVDITSALPRKKAMLRCHRSQQEWLEQTQAMDAFLDHMEETSRELGRRTGQGGCVEGWRRRSPLGFSAPDFDPLSTLIPHAYAPST